MRLGGALVYPSEVLLLGGGEAQTGLGHAQRIQSNAFPRGPDIATGGAPAFE